MISLSVEKDYTDIKVFISLFLLNNNKRHNIKNINFYAIQSQHSDIQYVRGRCVVRADVPSTSSRLANNSHGADVT